MKNCIRYFKDPAQDEARRPGIGEIENELTKQHPRWGKLRVEARAKEEWHRRVEAPPHA